MERLVLPGGPEVSPEQAVLAYYTERGWMGFYGENVVWKSLFGLAFWDIIFMPVPGAFFHRYQRGPVGLFTPDFRKQREDEVQRRLEHILESETWPEEMVRRYDEKEGTANYLVNWKYFTREELELSIGRINRDHLVGIFDRLSRDIRENKTGFPDLILFPHSSDGGGYELAEVKGPGDALQKNQKRWMRCFHDHGIPFKVVNVVWE